MPVTDIVFQGINRAISDYSSTGACEELINLRPTTGGLVPVKPFKDKYNADKTFGKIFIHKVSLSDNTLMVRLEPISGTLNYKLVIALLNADGTETIIDDSITMTNFAAARLPMSSIHFAAVGNIALFSIANNHLQARLFKNLAFMWNGTSYKKITADVPSMGVEILSEPDTATGDFTVGSTPTLNELVDAINIGLNALEENNPSLCFGPVLVAFAYKTKDGSTFWTWNWLISDPSAAAKGEEQYVSGAAGATAFPNFFQEFDEGFAVAYINETVPFIMYGASIDLEISLNSAFDADTDTIESIEIYASRPVPYIDTDAMLKSGLAASDFGGIWDYEQSSSYCYIAPATKYKDMALDKQLLYHQKTILMKELEPDNPTTVSLTFGGNAQLVEKTLEVDAGTVTRYGHLLSYNARFHYYDAYSKTDIAMPTFSGLYERIDLLVDHHIFVVYNDGKKDRLLYLGTEKLFNADYPLVLAPSLNIREVHTYRETATDVWKVRIYLMNQSQTYNYTLSMGGPANNDADTDTQHLSLISQGTTTTEVITDEPDAINVTEQYNPFVFRVEHSYLAPGKVLDLQLQMVAVADVTYGDYPLNVFTNRGLYALLQGNGTVLYGAFRPVSNLVTTANSVPTESGTFFIAAGGLWLIAGSRAVLISDALSLGPHKFIRSNTEGYGAICNGVYHVEDYESAVSFEDYVSFGSGAKLAYNRYRDELFISNPDYDYCYVLSLKYRQWFKMNYTLSQDAAGDSIVKIPVSTGVWRVLDLSDETEDTSVLVHLQSRPFSMGYQYIHIHRIVAMIRAKLTGNDELVVALYGSDDLQNWKLLSYADRENVTISQIRTPSAARSWRYYTVTIGGLAPVDTDFGPVLFEHQPVIRRIG